MSNRMQLNQLSFMLKHDPARDAHNELRLEEMQLRIRDRLVSSLFAEADARADQGDLTEAIRAYRQTLQLNPRHAAARNNLGGVLMRLGRNREALVELEQAMKLDPEAPEPWANQGETLVQSSDLSAASNAYREALKRGGPSSIRARLAAVLLEMGQRAEAQHELEKALQADPEAEVIRVQLAECYLLEGRLNAAESTLQPALMQGSVKARLDLGAIRYLQNKLDDAETTFLCVVQNEPHNARAWFNLGLIAVRRGDVTSAIERFERSRGLGYELAEEWCLKARRWKLWYRWKGFVVRRFRELFATAD